MTVASPSVAHSWIRGQSRASVDWNTTVTGANGYTSLSMSSLEEIAWVTLTKLSLRRFAIGSTKVRGITRR